MKTRWAAGEPVAPAPKLDSNPPIDYQKAISYAERTIAAIPYWPIVSGVYLLGEGTRYYIGESTDVYCRVAEHRGRNEMIKCSGLTDPRGVLLAEIPWIEKADWNTNKVYRLIAERRFISAGLRMGLVLTNKMSEPIRARVAEMFTDLDAETSRLRGALDLLGDGTQRFLC